MGAPKFGTSLGYCGAPKERLLNSVLKAKKAESNIGKKATQAGGSAGQRHGAGAVVWPFPLVPHPLHSQVHLREDSISSNIRVKETKDWEHKC